MDDEQGQEVGNEEFVTLSSIPSFDDIPTSMIESSILDLNEAMEQVTQKQHVVTLSTFVAIIETPPLVSTIVILATTTSVITSKP